MRVNDGLEEKKRVCERVCSRKAIGFNSHSTSRQNYDGSCVKVRPQVTISNHVLRTNSILCYVVLPCPYIV